MAGSQGALRRRRSATEPLAVLPHGIGPPPHPHAMKDDRMFDIQREELIWAGRKLVLETGKIARQADGAVVATYGETTVLATVVVGQGAEARHRFPAAHRELPGAHLRGRPHPRRLLQARRPADREGDPGLPPDRPPDPSAVRRGLAQRHPGRRHRAVARPRERSRHRRDGRGLRRPDAFGRALHGSGRRGPRRPTSTASTSSIRRCTRWRTRPSTSSSPAPPTRC